MRAHQCPFIAYRGAADQMWEKVEKQKMPELHDPVLLVSLSTGVQQYKVLYSHAKELAKFMLKKMEFQELATLYSSALPPIAIISDEGTLRLPSTSFHLHRGRRDIVLLAGDASPLEDQYNFCDAVLSYAHDAGIGKVVSVGTRWTEQVGTPLQSFKVKGFATDDAGVRELEEVGVEIIRDEPAPYFSSLVVALAEKYGMRGLKVSVDHGEPIPHPRSVTELLSVLQKMLGFKIDLKELRETAERMAAQLEQPPGPENQPKPSGVYG